MGSSINNGGGAGLTAAAIAALSAKTPVGAATELLPIDDNGTLKNTTAAAIAALANGAIVVLHTDGTQTVYTDLATAFTASLATETIIVGPGTFLTSAPLAIKAGQTIILQGSQIQNSGTGDVFTATSVSGWSLVGNGTLTGSQAGDWAGSPQATTYQTGVRVTGSGNFIFNISGLTMTGFKGCGISLQTTISTPGAAQGKISDCVCTASSYGLNVAANSEFHQFTNIRCSQNGNGIQASAGNLGFVNCYATRNTFDGFIVGNGNNSAHGTAVGCHFTHNNIAATAGYGSLKAAGTTGTPIINGFHFVGCQIVGDICLTACAGITIEGGNVFGNSGSPTITMTGTFTGQNYITNVNFLGGEPIFSYGTGGARNWLVISNCTVGQGTQALSTSNDGITLANALKFNEASLIAAIKAVLTAPTNLKGAWFMDQSGAAATITDRAGNSHTTTLSANGNTLSPSVAGSLPTLTFPVGATSNFQIPGHADFDFSPTKPFSVIALHNSDATGAATINFLTNLDYSGAHGQWWFTQYNSHLGFAVLKDGLSNWIGKKASAVTTGDRGAWHVYAGTYADSATTNAGIHLYNNGVALTGDAVGAWDSGTFDGMTTNTTVVTANGYLNNGNIAQPFTGIYGFGCVIAEELSATQVARISELLLAAVGSY